MKTRILACAFVIVFGLMLVLAPAYQYSVAWAQNKVTCDSTLTTLLLLAVRDYGYKTSIDLTPYNFGQYTGIWEAIGGAKLAVGVAGTAVGGAMTAVSVAGTAVGEAEDAVDEAGTAVGGLPGLPGVAKTVVGQAGTAVGGAKTAVGGANTAVAGAGQIVSLVSGIIPGEHAVCTRLRGELETFFTPILQQKK